jgi:hypothetical protein
LWESRERGGDGAQRKKILDRLAKIMALADGTEFAGEAENARKMAEALMAEHGVGAEDVADIEFELRKVPSYYDFDAQWDRILKWAIAELNNCLPLMYTKPGDDEKVTHFGYVGRPIDIDAALYMTDELIRQRGRAFMAYAARGGQDGKAKFFFGYAKGLRARVDDIRLKAETSMAARGKSHLGPRAIHEREDAWLKRNHGGANPIGTFGGMGSGAGYDAGSGASFTRGRVDAPQGRLTYGKR